MIHRSWIAPTDHTESAHIELYGSSSSGLRAQASAAADAALHDRHSTLVLGLDNLAELDDAAVSATIVALRKLRQVGGSVRLVTQNADHRKRLAMTGLDRIFEIFPTAETAAKRPNATSKGALARQHAFRIARAIATALLFLRRQNLI